MGTENPIPVISLNTQGMMYSQICLNKQYLLCLHTCSTIHTWSGLYYAPLQASHPITLYAYVCVSTWTVQQLEEPAGPIFRVEILKMQTPDFSETFGICLPEYKPAESSAMRTSASSRTRILYVFISNLQNISGYPHICNLFNSYVFKC